MKPVRIVTFLLFCLPVITYAQDTPARMAEQYFEAMRSEGFASLGRFMHIVALQVCEVGLRFDRLEVVGSAKENNDIHVLTRMTIGAGTFSVTQFEVLSFTPYQNTWRLQLNGERTGMAQALRASVLGL